MRIGNRHSDPQRKRLKPPPDYTSRGMQWRLLGVVALLMLVITVAFEARDAQRWKWLTQLDRLQAQPDGDIDPRLKEPVDPQHVGDELIIGPPVRPKSKSEDATTPEPALTVDERAWASGWEGVIEKLGNYDRRMIYELLKCAREEKELAEAEVENADNAIRRVDHQWAEYRAIAKNGLQDLTEEERAAYQPVLEKLELRWSVMTKPLLMTVAQRERLSLPQRTSLSGLQELLDRLELKAVQDNTLWRGSEREIWLRLFGKLQQLSPAELQDESAGNISYAQLYRQPKYYRGKAVTIRGTAEAVYEEPAPKNTYGIERYWVYWIRPTGGPNSPILVYALEKPDRFPSFEYADMGHRKLASREEVEFTGLFFKRYAYEARGVFYTTPLLLARSPKWIPANEPKRPLPSALTFVGIFVGLAGLAAGLATWVYFQYPAGRTRDLALPDELPLTTPGRHEP